MTPIEKIKIAIKNANGKCFAVGGSVRDELMKLTPKDTDLLVTGIPVDKLKSILPGKIDLVGASFGVIKVTIDNVTIDIALPRTEKSTGSGHRDFDVQSDHTLPIEVDLSRRDFTCNAIAINLEDGSVVDPFGGIVSINDKEIKAVGEARERFEEDPLRMMRAIRFVAKLGFDIEKQTLKAISKSVHLLDTVAKERISEELVRMLMCSNEVSVLKALRVMRDTGVLSQIIPQFNDSIGFDQKNPHHNKTIDEHVFDAVRHAVLIKASSRVRVAALLHDIAKPMCFSFGEDNIGHFTKHEDFGATITESILKDLRFSVDDVRDISKMVREHLRPMPGVTDKALRRFVAALGPLVNESVDLREADLAAHKHFNSATAKVAMNEIRCRLLKLNDVSGFNVTTLALNGNDIATIFNVKDQEIGYMKKKAVSAVIDGDIKNDREEIIKFLRGE